MNDPQEPNHWDLLVSKLGATPPPPEPKTPEDKLQQEEKAVQQGPKGSRSSRKEKEARSAPAPRRAPTDWGQVAEQLGIDRQEALGEPPPREAGSPSSRQPAEGAQGATPLEGEAAGPRAESGGPGAATGVGPVDAAIADSDFLTAEQVAESTRTELVPAGAEAGLPGFAAERAESVARPDERMPERKDRKRRPKPTVARGQQPAETAVEAPASESANEATGPLAGDAPSSEAPGEEPPEDAGAPTEQNRSPERSKRRRRRGPGRRKGGTGRDGEPAESEGPEELAAEGDESQTPQMAGAEAVKRKSDKERAKSGSRKDAKSEKAPKSAKTAHRGIPNWAEAVGIVIAANMEARAKRPSTSSRSRGGRGRGGRDRSGDKSK